MQEHLVHRHFFHRSIVTSSFRSIIASLSHRSIVTSPQDPSFRPIAPSSHCHIAMLHRRSSRCHSSCRHLPHRHIVASFAISSHLHRFTSSFATWLRRHIVTSHRRIVASSQRCIGEPPFVASPPCRIATFLHHRIVVCYLVVSSLRHILILPLGCIVTSPPRCIVVLPHCRSAVISS